MKEEVRAQILTLVRVAMMLALMLLSWGWDDIAGFFAHPARAAMTGWAVLMALVFVAMRIDVRPFRHGSRPVGHQRWIIRGVLAVGLALFLFLPYGDRRGLLTLAESGALRYVGLALIPIGDLAALAGLRALGRQYSGFVTLQDDHKLIQHGIYGVIRHPIYLRALLVMIGLPLVFNSWLVVPGFLFAVAFVTVRIRQEERLLAEEFGAEFEAYRKRTARLIPYIF